MVRKPTATGLTASRDRLESIYGECVSKGVSAASTQIEAWREEIFTARVDQSNDAVFSSGWMSKRYQERGVVRARRMVHVSAPAARVYPGEGGSGEALVLQRGRM